MRQVRRILIGRAIRARLRAGVREEIRQERGAAAVGMTVEEVRAAWSRYTSGGVSLHEAITGKPLKAKAMAGRQTIRMPTSGHSIFGGGWAGLIPAGAHEAPWEDYHSFPKGGRPRRDSVGMHGDPPIAFVCPGCDLAQPPFTEDRRDCGYCGLNMRRHGSRLYWWRKEISAVAEWKP